MKLDVPRVVHLLLAAILLSSLAGCSATHAMPGDKAIMCAKCRIVWVQRPDPADPDWIAYVSEQAMECPDCRSAVASFFETGRLEHTCATCGEALAHCTVSR